LQASENAHESEVRVLVSLAADVNKAARDGSTPLMAASHADHVAA
jgi:ankyrin repeat protein